uniref:Uncharacterized protein n=1 Tax=Arundo donax TaxID=35708 RepID=A0A0A9H0S9_ARUDO
MAWRRAGRAGV